MHQPRSVGGAHLTYRAAPQPCSVFVVPSRTEQLIDKARAAHRERPRDLLVEVIGNALRKLHAGVIAEPLPEQLRKLAEALGEAEQRLYRAGEDAIRESPADLTLAPNTAQMLMRGDARCAQSRHSPGPDMFRA